MNEASKQRLTSKRIHKLYSIALRKMASTVHFKSKSHYDRKSVGQSVLVSGAHLGTATNFYFSLRFYSDSCGFVIL
jgi:hypothetical protein